MNSLSTRQFIDRISDRPGMYIFSEGITELCGYLRGYSYARDSDKDADVLEDFTAWLKREKYSKFEDMNVGWCRMILFFYPCEKRALQEFFDLWIEFKLETD